MSSYPAAFARWITSARAADFLALLRELCGVRRPSGSPGHRRTAAPPAGRWVQREGCTVRFSRGAAPGQSRIHVHRLPDHRIAERFALALMRTCRAGHAAPLDPEEWAGWQREESGRISTPPPLPVAIPLADRRAG